MYQAIQKKTTLLFWTSVAYRRLPKVKEKQRSWDKKKNKGVVV